LTEKYKLEVRFPKYDIIFRIIGGQLTAYVPEVHRGSLIHQDLLKFLSEVAEKDPIKLDTIQTLQNWEALQDWYDNWDLSRKSIPEEGSFDL
jgi:hypothetical protein